MLKRQAITLLFGLTFSTATFARLSVAPQFVLFDKSSPKVQMVNVVNGSDTTKTFNIKLLHYKQNENGSYSEIEKEDENNKFIDDIIFFGPRRFTLEPKEAQTIKIQRKPKSDLATGEYRSHMLFQEAEAEEIATKETKTETKGLSFKITALYGVSIPVIMQIGDLFSTASISNIKLDQNDKGTSINFDINRTGTKSIRGDLSVKNGDEEIGILKGVNVFLSINKRNVSIPLKSGNTKETLKGKTLKIEYISNGKVITSSDFTY